MELNNIPEIFQSKLRLMIISALLTGKKTFKEIKEITRATDGNISVQLSNLEKVGYIAITKTFTGKKPQTIIEITSKGHAEFVQYVNLLNRIISSTEYND